MRHRHRPTAAHWREVVPQEPEHHLSHFEAFETFVAVDVEDESGTKIRVFSLPDVREIPVPRPAAIGVASSSFENDSEANHNEANFDPTAKILRFRFSGPLQPQCVYDFDVTTGVLRLRKQDPASRWLDRDRYAVDRLNATAPDGERVPITIVYRKEMRHLGGNPTLIVGYGAYGSSLRATFRPSVFSLIDRGFVYAIAHVRGGHEKGERWYAEGRMLNKRNTFTDFIAATEMLIAQGYADPRAVFAQGGSAGGLLMGAIANLRPDLYAGIVAEAPFVDVVTTMSDASVPLTTLEYDEWGNPAVKREYDYMLSYSPYDNVARRNYPAMFVTAGFYDSQVSYAEPAKWVARLRASKTDTHDSCSRPIWMPAMADAPAGSARSRKARKSWAGSSRMPVNCVEWRKYAAKSLWGPNSRVTSHLRGHPSVLMPPMTTVPSVALSHYQRPRRSLRSPSSFSFSSLEQSAQQEESAQSVGPQHWSRLAQSPARRCRQPIPQSKSSFRRDIASFMGHALRSPPRPPDEAKSPRMNPG